MLTSNIAGLEMVWIKNVSVQNVFLVICAFKSFAFPLAPDWTTWVGLDYTGLCCVWLTVVVSQALHGHHRSSFYWWSAACWQHWLSSPALFPPFSSIHTLTRTLWPSSFFFQVMKVFTVRLLPFFFPFLKLFDAILGSNTHFWSAIDFSTSRQTSFKTNLIIIQSWICMSSCSLNEETDL